MKFFKQFFKNLLLWHRRSDFEIISQECSLGDPLQKCSRNFDPSINMALMNGGFLHYRDMKKFLKNLLLRNRWSDFEIISQESGFNISRRPDCPIRAVIVTGKLSSPFVSPPGKYNFRVFIADTVSFLSLRSNMQIDIELFTELL